MCLFPLACKLNLLIQFVSAFLMQRGEKRKVCIVARLLKLSILLPILAHCYLKKDKNVICGHISFYHTRAQQAFTDVFLQAEKG